MQYRGLLRGRRRRIASAAGLCAALAAAVVVAFAARGYPLNQVDLNDGGVWVTNDDLGAVGRFNTTIDQLDADLIVNHESQPDVDVLQRAGVVFAIDHTANTLRRIDVAGVSLSDQTVDLPPDASVAFGGDVVAISDPVTGRVWARPIATILATSVVNAKPTIVTGAHVAITVASDGTVYAFVPATGQLVTIRHGGGDSFTASGHQIDASGHGVAGTAAQVAAVGTRPVVLAGGDILLPGGRRVSLPPASAAGATLQQSGPDSRYAYVATDTTLFRVDLSSGTLTALYSGGGGGPAAPVRARSCVYAAWGGNAEYLRRCDGQPEQAARPLQGLPPAPRLVFRVNRDAVVLNEVATGAVYAYPRGGADLGNWQSLMPKSRPRNHANKSKKVQADKRNHAPTARPDSYGARPGETSRLHVLDNDGDPDADILVIASVSGLPASAGRVAIVDNGQAIQFTADETWTGTATFTYRIDDGKGGTDSAKVTLTSRPGTSNKRPTHVQRDSVAHAGAGGTVTYPVLGDWRDPDGDPLTLISATTKAPDTVQFTADGKVTFTATGPSTRTRTVDLQVSDGRGHPVAGTLTVKVSAPGKGPVGANDDRVTGVVGQALTIHPLNNDTDPNISVPGASADDQLRLISVSAAPAGATAAQNSVGNTIQFTAQRARTYYLTYQATDNEQVGKARIRVDIVTPSTANPPVAVADRAVVRGDRPTDIDVLANDIDPSGNVMVVSGVTAPPDAGLTASVIAHRWVRVTPSHPGSGTVTLHYQLSDGGGTDTGAIEVTLLSSSVDNQPPTTHDDVATVRVGDVTAINVLANDSDPEGEPLRLSPVVTPDSSAGDWVASGSSIRFLAPGKPGTFVAHYAVTDPEGAVASAKVTVTVIAAKAAANQPPQPPTVQARTFAGATVRIPIPRSGVDPDGDSVVLLGAVDAPRLGRITGQGAGYLTYQAYAGSSGTDAFKYRVADQYGARSTGTVRVGVIPRPAEDSPPSAVADDVIVAPGRVVNVPVLANDSDVDGDRLRVEPLGPLNPHLLAGTKLNGSVITIHAGTHDGDQVKVRYGISDGRGRRAEATVTVTSQTGATIAPVAVDDVAKPVPYGATSVTVDVLANDYDIDGGPGDLTLVPVDTGPAGPSRVTPKGLVIPLAAQPRLVPYQIVDSDHQVAMGYVRVPGTAASLPRLKPDAPALQVKSGGTLTVDLTQQVEDPAGLPIRLTAADGITTSPNPGLDLAPKGLTEISLVLRGAATYTGPASLVVTVTDAPVTGAGSADTAARSASITLPVTVLASSSATPVFQCPDAHPQAGGVPVTVDLGTCVSGISPRAAARLSYTSPKGVATGVSARLTGGTLAISADERAKTGTRSEMRFTVTDALGRSGPARLGVVVTPAPLVQPGTDRFDIDAGTTRTFDVTANDENPFPGRPLHVTSITGGSKSVTAKVSGNTEVAITAAGGFHGAATFTYTVGDATNDPSRVVYGEIIVNVVGKPGMPGTPVEQSVGDGYVLLAWTAPPANGAAITGYEVTGSPSYRHTCSTTVCKLTGLTNGKKYRFTVHAVNRVGTGPASAASAPMEPDVVPDQPSAPVTAFGDRFITLNWPAAHSSGSPVRYYLVQISPPVSAPVQVTGTHLVWSGLTNGTSYTFRIKAYNDAPNGSTWSPYSNPETPAAAPDRPLAPTAAGVTDGIGKQMVVNWQAPNNNGAPITAYHLSVYRAGSLVQTLAEDGDVTRTTVTVVNGVSYTFRITATNKAGVSKPSATSAPQVAHGKPGVVTSFSVSDHNGVTGYNHAVKYTLTAPNDNGMAISTYQFSYSGTSVYASSSSTSGMISGLTNGASYRFRVRACNDMCGDWSSPSASVSPYGPPPKPNVSGSQSGSNQVKFVWSSGGTNGRPIDHMLVSVDGGSWQSKPVSSSLLVGNGPAQTHSIQVRAVDTPGQKSVVASASATTASPPASVTLTHGAATDQPDCHSPCNYVVIELQHFPPNTSVTCTLKSGHSGGTPFATVSTTTDSNGYRKWQSAAYYGYYGTYLEATCNGVTGRNNSW